MDMILFPSVLAWVSASPVPLKLCQDGVSVSRRLFPAPARTASAAGPGNGIPRSDFGGRDRPPVYVPAMNPENRTEGLASGRHFDKSRSPGFITRTVLHHVHPCHPAKPFKDLAQIVPRDIARQIPDMDIHSVPLFLGIEPPWFEDVFNKKK